MTRFWIIVGTIGVVLFAGLSWTLRRSDWRAIEAAVDESRRAATVRPEAEVVRALRSMELVTVQLQTLAESESTDSSWRGDVTARVSAPVILHYGVDLSKMDVNRVAISPVSGTVIVRVPIPHRIATEVVGGQEETGVSVGWLRSRSIGGEYHLGLARKGLYNAADRLRLAAEDGQRVRDMTRDQVHALVEKILGPAVEVAVVFTEDDE